MTQVGLGRRGPAEAGRKEVLEAAATVFMDRGFTATSVDDIAEVLGATKGRIYHYYRSKTDIFLDLLTLSMNDLLGRIRPIADRTDLSPSERLRAAARMHALVMMTQSARSRVAVQATEMHLMQDAGAKQRAALEEFVRMRDEYEQYYAAMVEEGIAAGEFRAMPPRLAAKPILGALNWINMWFRPREGQQEQGDPEVEAIADQFADFVVAGLAVPAVPAEVSFGDAVAAPVKLLARRVGRVGRAG